MIPGRFLLRATIVAAGFALAAVPTYAQTDRPELVEVRFSGNEAVPSDSLQSIILNRPTTCRSSFFAPVCWVSDALRDRRYLVPRQVPVDSLRIVAYYYTLGYREAVVDTALTEVDGGVRLGFDIREGRPVVIDSISFTVYDDPQVPGLLNDLPVQVGQSFSTRRLEAIRDTVTGRLYDAGYAHAEVFRSSFIPRDQPYSAEVVFEVDPGPRVRFGEISVESNRELTDQSIIQMLPFRPGQLYRPALVEEGQRAVYSLGMIRNATVQPVVPDPQALDTVFPIRVTVQEGDKHRVRTGAGWSTANCFNAEARWTSRNFFGGARRLTVSAGVSNILAPQLVETACFQSGDGEFGRVNGRVGVELLQPTIFSSRNSLSTNAFIERESLPDVFVREAIGIAFGLTRAVSRRTTATLSWEPQLTRLDAGEASFCIYFLICTEGDISAFRSANWLSPVGLNLGVDRTNRVLNPTGGWTFGADLEHASRFTGSDFAYNRIAAELTGYVDLGDQWVLALRARGGGVDEGEFFKIDDGGVGIVHPQKRFYAGGANTVRGFAENRLGPRVLSVPDVARLLETPVGSTAACTPLEVSTGACDPGGLAQEIFDQRPTGGSRMLGANAELRIPLGGSTFQAVAFVDVGEVWSTDQPTEFADLEVTPGLGFRYFSPVGPIRIDVGYRPRGTEALTVITPGIRPYDPIIDDAGDRIRVRGPSGTTEAIDWVRSGELRILDTRYPFDSGDPWWSRLQLHFSIGQAF